MNSDGAWVIQRTAPCEPVSFWGRMDRWILRRRPAELIGRVPEAAMRFQSYDAAFDLAEWLRTHQPLAYGEVIAVTSAPDPVPA